MRSPQHPEAAEISLSQVLHALSDPIRLRLVRCLSDAGVEQQCGALYNSMSKSTLSHHFKVLREAGVIFSRPEGTRFMNSLRREDLDARFPGLLDAVLKADEPL
jgi:DNA-binding transcriptional ArsR family regulator